MISLRVIWVLSVALSIGNSAHVNTKNRDVEAEEFIRQLSRVLDVKTNIATIAEWAYASNITDHNEQQMNEIAAENAEFLKAKTAELLQFAPENFKDEDLKRQYFKFTKLGYAALQDEDYRELLSAISKMQSNYAKVKICDYNDKTKCDLSLEPEIENVISSSRDPEELKYYWVEWYDKAGTAVREPFQKYVELNGKAAQMNGFKNGADAWLSEYEDETFEQQLDDIFDGLRPLYQQLHGYVRYRLRQRYGDAVVSEKGPIPMHLLGNMWAQTWDNIASFVVPYPDKELYDVTEEMQRQGYTQLKMFQMGDKFFQSLNMTKVPKTFWDKSILVKPDDGRELICHASAWDFFVRDDVRIKQCTDVTMDQFFTVHHELGHIQYFLQYQHLPHVYRDGANPGFHEAVGDVLSLSVSTPKHLQKIGLLPADLPDDHETKINQLFLKGLSKVVFLPFAFTLDKYRWGIFRGDIKPEDYNCAFWKLREEYSGIEPPVVRTESDFDAPAKYHVSADVEYLRYLVSFIVQFQFYKAACIKAGEYEYGNPKLPLDNCDIYESAAAGNAFKAMLELGSSKPWPDAMEVLTGERIMSGEALKEYFAPLYDWLKENNEKNGVYIGWEPSDKCVKTLEPENNGR